ncbi:MAG: PDDEXK nuclease domain-containing protein [Methanosarcinales archaeon]|nr:PDDEXK nuclease domain-containing protein [Methanosarcinales archaeon]
MMDIQKQESFQTILTLIQDSRNHVFATVNRTLVELYWRVGEYVSKKVDQEVWGKSTVKELSLFIQREHPDIKGFTASNIWRMKQFYETYAENQKLASLWRELSWTHNRTIFSRCKTDEERAFYLHLTTKNRLSVREMEKQISSGTFERAMLANGKLSETVKKLPQETESVFRDSYLLDFLNLPAEHSEKYLQKAIIASLKKFILELGGGFAFIGEEYRLQVGNDDFYLDLLFYHRNLNCLVVFELKVDKFRPAHLGQLEFYLEALDRDVKFEHENPSIGILLCREKDDEVVKYALSRSFSPAVVSEYETKLIPREVLRRKMNELYQILEGGGDENN